MDGDRLDLTADLQLPADPASPRQARRFVEEFCGAAGMPPEVCETAALLVSELAANAVLHGRSGTTIKVNRPNGHLRVSVFDDNAALRPTATSPQPHSETGRGLHILSVLADDWGVEAHDGGKAVWFRLTLPASDA